MSIDHGSPFGDHRVTQHKFIRTLMAMLLPLRLTAIFVLVGIPNCAPPLSSGKDFDNKRDKNFRLLFSIGDEYVTVGDMFIYRTTDNNLCITRPGKDSPDVASYLANPKGSPYRVVRLIPKSTRILLVGIKDSFNSAYIPYFNIDGDPIWVGASEFGVPDCSGLRRWTVDYNHTLFKRVKRGSEISEG